LTTSQVPFNPRSRAEWAEVFVRSVASGIRHRGDFGAVERYCFFVGYARSGHSLIGSLLNAHPEMVVSNELNSLRFVQHGFRRNQLFALVLARDAMFGDMGRLWTGYDYSVPHQFQGRFTRLKVIGDKQGGGSTRRLRDNLGLIERVRRVVRVPIRVLHVTRNPFDNIARMTVKSRFDLQNTIERYSGLCDGVSAIRASLSKDELLDIRYEDFVASASDSLRSICSFLGVDAGADYLKDCASIVEPTANKARNLVEWTEDDREMVSAIIARHAVLAGYTFES
jgi:hypothetical protein